MCEWGLKTGFLVNTCISVTNFLKSTISHCLISQSLATAEEKEETEEENREETLEVHKPWVSLGSEKEVEEESLKERDTKVRINRCYSIK